MYLTGRGGTAGLGGCCGYRPCVLNAPRIYSTHIHAYCATHIFHIEYIVSITHPSCSTVVSLNVACRIEGLWVGYIGIPPCKLPCVCLYGRISQGGWVTQCSDDVAHAWQLEKEGLTSTEPDADVRAQHRVATMRWRAH
jgi:hypothetical protein